MLVHQYIIPRNERAGPLIQYRIRASWYRCGSSLRSLCLVVHELWDLQQFAWLTPVRNCLWNKWELQQFASLTVRNCSWNKWELQQFGSFINASVLWVCHFGVLTSRGFPWVPEVERLGSQTRQSELAFLFIYFYFELAGLTVGRVW